MEDFLAHTLCMSLLLLALGLIECSEQQARCRDAAIGAEGNAVTCPYEGQIIEVSRGGRICRCLAEVE